MRPTTGLLASKEAVTHRYGFPTLSHEYLPLFKMKAYLNLREAEPTESPYVRGKSESTDAISSACARFCHRQFVWSYQGHCERM